MIAPRKLNNAPIKEALIDIQTVLPKGIEANTLDISDDAFLKRYPNKEALYKGAFGIRMEGGQAVGTSIEQGQIGYKYTSEDGKQIVQFRTDGFTYSQLEPYDKWETLRDEAFNLWELYTQLTGPDIRRIAVRYINLLKIPLPIGDIKKYLAAPPETPADLGLSVNSFLTRIVMADPESGATAILTQALEAFEEANAPIVLDIDVFLNNQYDHSDPEIWADLDKLRKLKNIIFFESITEDTEGLCQ